MFRRSHCGSCPNRKGVRKNRLKASRVAISRRVGMERLDDLRRLATLTLNGEAPVTPDSFESNNDLGSAVLLGSARQTLLRDLTIHSSAEVDFFRHTANETGKSIIRIDFAHALGDLELRVLD